jgi:hypothetical protein
MWTYLGKRVREGRIWTDNEGRRYPPQWWGATSYDDKVSLGLVWVNDPAPYDNRFYWDANTPKNIEDVDAVDEDGNPVLDEDGVQIVTKGLKSQAIAQTKVTAGSLLAPTDWMVIKAAEVEGFSVPAEVTTYRAAVRTASNDIEAAITACTTHDAFMALYTTPVDENGDPTGPAPINAWPEAI